MATLTLRSQKGSPLTNQEVDDNFSNLNTSKLETSSLGSGTFGVSIGTAGATNTTVTWGTSTGFTANTSSNYTYDLKVGPALTNLAALMTTAGAGFIKRGATADTYTIDTNTYLTSESDTLASVTARGASTSTSLALTGTNPISLQGNSNNATYTQSVIYANQNNTSANDANGIFIERGRLADSASAEIRNFVIGARGGQIQWKLDGSGNTSQTGYASLTSNSAQLRLFRTDASGPAWSFYSWTSGLNIFPATASTIWIGRDGGSTDMQLYNGNLYAPIMYDTNNTGYYVDPASTSRFNDSYISTGTYGTRTNNSIFGGNMTGMGGASQLLEVRTNGSIPLLTWHYENIATRHIGLDSSGFLQVYNPGETGGSVLQANSSLRAPIFYDSDNTAYYTDPNTATSANFYGSVNAATYNLAGLLVNASGSVSTGGAIAIQQVTSEGWTGIFVDYEPYTGWGLWHDNPNNYFLITAESDTANIASNSVPSRSSGNRTAYTKFRFQQGDAVGIAGGSWRAPIFYDSNDTTYWVDPANSGFNLRGGTSNRVTYYTDDSGYKVANSEGTGITMRLGAAWNRAGIYSNSYLDLGAESTIAWRIGNIEKGYMDSSSNLFAYGSMRAPIFYDYNDTNFYVDPASTSKLEWLNVRRLAVNPDNNTSDATTGTLSLWSNPDSTTSTLMFKRTDQLYGTHGAVTDQYATFWNMDTTNRGWIFRNASTNQNVFSISNNGGTVTIGNGGFTPGSTFARLNVHAGSNSATLFRDIDLFGGWSGGEGHAITATHGTASSSIVGQMVFQHDGPGSRIKWGRLYHSGNQSTYPMELVSSSSTAYLRLDRDLYISGGGSGNYGNRLIVGNTDTSYTLQDGNLRPTIQAHGQYPVLSLNHTVTSNSNHGPTIQMTANGVGNQFVIGMTGNGTALDMGYSSSGDWNPHNGIAGYSGTTFFRATSGGYIGLGAPGDWGAIGGGDPGYHLHFKGYNNANSGYAAVFENTVSATNNGGGVLFQNNNSNHSWGVVAEIRTVAGASGADRPSLLFSTSHVNTSWSIGFVTGSDDTFRISKNHGHRAYYGSWADNNSGWGTPYLTINTSGNVTAPVDMRSPIFYDSNDTAYYADPNGSSRFNSTFTSQSYTYGWFRNYGAQGLYNEDYGNHWYATGNDYWNLAGNNGSQVGIILRTGGHQGTVRGYVYADSSNNVGFLSNGGAWRLRVVSGDYSLADGSSMRAQLYYDSNDTNYYVDPASTSVLNALSLIGNQAFGTATTQSGPWTIGVIGSGGATPATKGTGFGRNLIIKAGDSDNGGGLAGGDLYLRAGSPVAPATAYGVVYLSDNGGYTQAGGSLRAPIFYDSDNTGYYVDPNGTSNFWQIQAFDGKWYTTNNGSGNSVEVYARPDNNNSYVWRHIYGGTGTGYGTGVGGYGIYSQHLGGDYSVIFSASGFVTAPYSFRSPIFYDSNDTGFYVDPNSSSNLSSFTAATLARAGHNVHYQNRTAQTGDSNYWVGSQGWGGSYTWNSALGALGSCFMDHWGSSTGHPQGSGYVHAQGLQTLHYRDGTNAYGWQMVGAADATANRYWARGKWGGSLSGWLEFVMSGSNPGYTLYSTIYYDSNDTGYYLDPNSTSDSALRIRGGALHGPNATWGAYLLVGGDGRQNYTNSGTTASICATNGNLHIDSASGYQTYINWYDGVDLIVGAGDSATERFRVYGSSNYTQATGSLRAPIFYDSDDTGYYCDPNSTSKLYRISTSDYAGSTSSGNVAPLEIRNNGGTGDGAVAAISWHCTGYYGLQMHLRHDGYFGIGGWSASTWRWYVNNTNGDMTAAGNVTAYSDPRLKEEITPIASAIEKVKQLNGVHFRWKEISELGKPGSYDYGVLATDVEKIAPELVCESAITSPDGDAYKTVAYDKLVPFLIEAVKEQQQQIDKLTKLVEVLLAK